MISELHDRGHGSPYNRIFLNTGKSWEISIYFELSMLQSSTATDDSALYDNIYNDSLG